MIYGEHIDLGRRRKCIVIIRVIDGKVFAEMTFYNNEKLTHNVIIYKDTDADVVKVSHNGKRFPEYVKRVVNYPHLTPLVFEVGACNSSS